MLDIGMTELLLIGIVTLIVVGPKDLPGMFRTLGRFTARARQLGRQFTQAMNDAADQSGMKDAADSLKGVSNPRKFGMDKLNEAASNFEKWDPSKSTGKPPEHGRKQPDPEREADVAKIREATQKSGQAKLDAEKAAAAEADASAEDAATDKPSAKTPAAKKTPAKKPAAKKTTAKSASTTKSTAKKPAAKSTGAAKTATKPKTTKSTGTKSTGTKTTGTKTAATKTAAKSSP